MEIQICQFTKKDMETAMDLKETEGWNQTLSDWEFILEQNQTYCFVAKVNGATVATISAFNYQDDLAWIGMMLVDRSFRRRGISHALMNKVISSLKSVRSIKLDATPAGLQVYRNLGFIEEYTLCRLVRQSGKKLKSFQPGFEIQKIMPPDIGELVKMDTKVFGTDRRKLLEYLYRIFPEGGFIIKEQNQVLGYLLCRMGTRYLQLGPLVAQNDTMAQSLIYLALERFKEKVLVLDTASLRTPLISWLDSMGFNHQRDLIRMYLKDSNINGMPSNYYLICGPEFG